MSYNSEDYFLSNDFKAILRKFESAGDDEAFAVLDTDELVDVAEYYYNNGKADKSEYVIEKTLAMYPGSTAPLLFKARLALMEGKDVGTAEYYAEQIEDKSDPEYFYMKAEIMLARNDADAADTYLEEKFGEADDDDKDYFAVDSAALFIDYNAVGKAEKWLRRSADKESVDYKEQAARIFMEKGDYENSKKLFNELIDHDPFSTQYWNLLASSQFFSNNIEDSIQSSEYSIAINPQNTAALLNKANGLYNLGNYGEALKYYLRYNSLCPDDENGEMLVGFCYMLLEDYGNAITHLKKAEELSAPQSPALVDVYKDMAFAYCRLGCIDDCMAVLDKADAISGDHDELLVYRGNMLLGSGRLEEAKKYFMQAIRSSGYSPAIFMKIAVTIFESGNPELAYKMFRTLYANYPDWTEGYAHYAACCYDLGKTDEFPDALKKAAACSPNETKMLLGKLFPDGMEPKDYYDYIVRNNRGKQPPVCDER